VTRSTHCLLLLATALVAACGDETIEAPPAVSQAPPAQEGQYLREITADVGIDFVQEIVLGGTFALPEISVAGCAIFDADGDGLLDIYFTNCGTGPENGAPNALFRRTADGRYEDVSAASGLDDRGYGFGVAVGDLDNDGDLDVYVGNWGRDRLYLNDGAGHFSDVTDAAGIGGSLWTTSVVCLDYDLDGFLDLYVVHYVDVDPLKRCAGVDSRRDYCGPSAFPYVADTLYRNRGDGTFEDVSAAVGIAAHRSPGLGVYSADFDGDGRPDVFVANDGAANHLWRSRPDGTLSEEALLLGVAYNGQGAPEASMGVAVGDVNGDGRDDVFLTHLKGQTNTLYMRRGPRAFADRTAPAGFAHASLTHTGWGVALLDLDHDGDLDLAIANGKVERMEAVSDTAVDTGWNVYCESNQLFLNDGSGQFTEASAAAGRFALHEEVSRGLAHGDLDGDGDLDIVVANARAPGRVYENVTPKRGAWLAVRAVDPALHRDAYGAVVRVRCGAARFQRSIAPASSYASSSTSEAHFGLGPVERVDEIQVVWPGGDEESFAGGAVNRRLILERGKGTR